MSYTKIYRIISIFSPYGGGGGVLTGNQYGFGFGNQFGISGGGLGLVGIE